MTRLCTHLIPEKDGSSNLGDRPPGKSAPPIFIEMPKGIEELIPDYLNSRKEDVVVLLELLSASGLEGIRRIAHNLKGNGSAYGFPRVTELGSAMERSARESNLSDLGEQIRALGEYLDRVQLRGPS